MKTTIIQGTQAYAQFEKAMKHVLTVSPATIKERIEAEKRKSAAKQVRPGPKRKAKPSAYPVPAV